MTGVGRAGLSGGADRSHNCLCLQSTRNPFPTSSLCQTPIHPSRPWPVTYILVYNVYSISSEASSSLGRELRDTQLGLWEQAAPSCHLWASGFFWDCRAHTDCQAGEAQKAEGDESPAPSLAALAHAVLYPECQQPQSRAQPVVLTCGDIVADASDHDAGVLHWLSEPVHHHAFDAPVRLQGGGRADATCCVALRESSLSLGPTSRL